MLSDHEVILRALRRVRRRLRLRRALRDATSVLGMLAAALLLWRVLQIFAGAPAIVALAILVALLFWVTGLFLLVRGHIAARCTLSTAAASVDARASLKEELTTAHWFLEHPIRSPWIEAQVARAAESVRRLNLASLLPLRLDWHELTGATGAALFLVVAWLVPPLAPTSGAAPGDHALPQAQAKQVQRIRELIGQTQDEAVAKKLEKAMATFERQTASAQEKQRALSAAEQAIEQQGLQAASTREGLYLLTAKLRNNEGLGVVARALEDGDVQGAARLMQRIAELDNSVASKASGSLAPNDEQRDLERLFATASREDHRAHAQSSGSATQETANRLRSIAQQLDAQGHWKEAAQALHQLQQAMPQGGYGADPRQQDAHDTWSENSGTTMAGTVAPETSVVAPDNGASGREAGHPAAAGGGAQNDAVLKAKIVPLQVQLQPKAIGAQRPESDEAVAKNWFYAATREQRSAVDFDNVAARSAFSLGQSTALDGVAVRHRQIVKDYFTALNQSTHP
jgi:hypothetical protein